MNSQTAIKILLGLFFGVLLLHLAVVLQFVPYDLVWGGRLNSDSEMYVFESISILINLYIVFILLMKGKYIKSILPSTVITISLWIFVGLFVLNTVGNLMAYSLFEKFFAILTAGAALLILKILRSD